MTEFRILEGDCREILRSLPGESVRCCVTSPPYWGLRDYGNEAQIGLERTPEAYVEELVGVFREVRRVLTEDGTLWLNLGDRYASQLSSNGGYSDKSTLRGFTHPKTKGRLANESGERRRLDPGLGPKDLVGIPWRVAFALQADGWCLRQDIIWYKPNHMPESVTDRCTKAHEYLFLLAKSARYYYDAAAIAEPALYAGQTKDYTGDQKPNRADPVRQRTLPRGRRIEIKPMRNRRSVWTVPTEPFSGAHSATFPEALVGPCVQAGSARGDVVLDPFVGVGTAGLVALSLGRRFIGIELNPEYAKMAQSRIEEDAPLFRRGSA